jgi:hypothetical protein
MGELPISAEDYAIQAGDMARVVVMAINFEASQEVVGLQWKVSWQLQLRQRVQTEGLKLMHLLGMVWQ